MAGSHCAKLRGMPNDSSVATARDIRRFAVIQVVITAIFLVVIYWLFSGPDDTYPPIWLIVVLMLAVATGAFFSERVWLSGTPLDPAADSESNQQLALDTFAAQTVRKLIYTELPLILAAVLCFFGNYGGGTVLVTAVPGLAVMAWETFPHLRNTSMAAAILESQGAPSNLVESFRTS